jgi:hypothetical protein
MMAWVLVKVPVQELTFKGVTIKKETEDSRSGGVRIRKTYYDVDAPFVTFNGYEARIDPPDEDIIEDYLIDTYEREENEPC